jgi:2',3'-cyclic-nucleotide 2'-phosphodiesterase (5'-nucleotidase family)
MAFAVAVLFSGAAAACRGEDGRNAESLAVSALRVEESRPADEVGDSPAGSQTSAQDAPQGVLASAVQRDVADPDLVLVYTASSQGYLEPCGCAVQGKEMGGVARRATLVDSLRAVGAPLLLVEAGDFVGGPGEPGRVVGEVSLQVMQRMGYDAIALGESELVLGEPFLQRAAAAGPAIAHANYSHPALGPAQKGGLLIEKGGLEIGVIGLLDPEALPQEFPLEDLVIEPPGPAAAAATASLRAAGADLVVVLGHGDFRSSGRIVLEAGGPDLWVVGHGGKELSQPFERGGALLLGAGNAGKLVGILELEMPPGEGDAGQGVAGKGVAGKSATAQGATANGATIDGTGAAYANRLYPLHLSMPEKPSIARLVKSVGPEILHRQGAGNPPSS